MTLLARCAIAYTELGWPVHPLRPRDKPPATKNGLHDATTDPAQAAEWWERWPDANIGLATGHAFDVLDVDSSAAMDRIDAIGDWPGPIGPVVGTAKGWHVYVQPTGYGNRAGLVPGVDWRGRGGYVVAPPSIHPDGHEYTWLGASPLATDLPVPTAPDWLVRLLEPKPAPPMPAIAIVTPDRWNPSGLIETMKTAVPGTRNETLNWCAYRLVSDVKNGRANPADAQRAMQLLADVAIAVGLAPSEVERTIASAMRGAA